MLKPALPPAEPIAVGIDRACELADVGRTWLYREIREGRLRARKAGTRTVIELGELRRFIAELPTIQPRAA